MKDPHNWAHAFATIPDAWKGVIAALVALFIVALIVKWWPRKTK